MAMLSARDSLQMHGPCYIADADGDIILGSITAADLETGEYLVARIDDCGRYLWLGASDVLCERHFAKGPLRLIPREGEGVLDAL
jgi:hypothetical protein